MSGVCSFSFGGINVLTTQYFAANGNATSLSLANFADTGNGSVLPVPMRIVGVGWEKSNETPGSFILMDDTHANPNLIININGVNGAAPIESDHEFNGVIRLRALDANGNNAFRSCRITLCFQPLGNFDSIGLNALPFGGTKPEHEFFLLRPQGDVRTSLDNVGAYIGTQLTIPSPMRLYRVGYQNNSFHPMQLQILKNGRSIHQAICSLANKSGVVDFPLAADSKSRQLNAGDVIQLRCKLSTYASAKCVLTLYTSQGTQVIL